MHSPIKILQNFSWNTTLNIKLIKLIRQQKKSKDLFKYLWQTLAKIELEELKAKTPFH